MRAERASLAAQSRRIETEAAPIRYVAELVGVDTDVSAQSGGIAFDGDVLLTRWRSH